MALQIQYFVNDNTRLCNMFGGCGEDHEKNVKEALKKSFREVTQEELDAFQAETQKAKDAGWNPNGRTSYSKFIEKQNSK